MGGERKREGVATIVTDIRSEIHHSRPQSGAGGAKVEGLARFYDVQRATSGAAFDTQTKLEIETEGSYDTTPSQLSRYGDGDGTRTNQASWTSSSPTLAHTQ